MKRKLIRLGARGLQQLVRWNWKLGSRVMDFLGTRVLCTTYREYGDFDEERGWLFFGEWISADE
jgi:hypothetical protein